MLTAEDLKRNFKAVPHPSPVPEEGMFWLNPDVELVSVVDSVGHGPKKGKHVHAWIFYDSTGKYPNMVQLREHTFWWELGWFELATKS